MRFDAPQIMAHIMCRQERGPVTGPEMVSYLKDYADKGAIVEAFRRCGYRVLLTRRGDLWVSNKPIKAGARR